jgi:hypothetical protein
MASLHFVRGHVSPGARVPLDRDETILGRHPDCDVVMHDQFVGRRQVRIVRRRDRFVLDILNNFGGAMFINGRRLLGACLLRDGDQIHIGENVVEFESAPGRMTEREWLDFLDPWRMLNCWRDQNGMSQRKLLLVGAACVRQFPGLWPQRPEPVTGLEPSMVYNRDFPILDSGARLVASDLRAFCRRATAGVFEASERVSDLDAFCDSLCCLLHDLAGNPFRPPDITPSLLRWNDGTVVKLAGALDEAQSQTGGHLDRDLLAVLADAVEDAGCTDTELVGHLRGPGPHWRGCWAVDALLGKA